MKRHARQFCRCFTALLAVTALNAGCSPRVEPVVTYTVPKHDSIQLTLGDASQPGSGTQPAEEGRLLAGFALVDDWFWSFKALGKPKEFPASTAEKLRTLLETVEFGEAKPSWELTDEWKEIPGSGMRTATLMLGDLEFSVIKIPVRTDEKSQYILDNVNRWRRQLSLPNIGLADLDAIPQLKTKDGEDAFVLDITGSQSGSAMGPMGGRPMARQPSPQRPTPGALPKPFSDKPPETWKSSPAGAMQLATYSIEEDGNSAKVSVARAGGDVLANLNRWRGQVGLTPINEIGEAQMDEITVSNLSGWFAEIHGEDGQSITVAMLPADQPTWFFKLQGDTEIVKQNTAPFREYLESVQLQ